MHSRTIKNNRPNIFSKRTDGFSLVSTLVAVGVMGVVSAGGMSFMSQNMKVSRASEMGLEREAAKISILNRVSCEESMPTNCPVNTVIALKDITGKNIAKGSGPSGSSLLFGQWYYKATCDNEGIKLLMAAYDTNAKSFIKHPVDNRPMDFTHSKINPVFGDGLIPLCQKKFALDGGKEDLCRAGQIAYRLNSDDTVSCHQVREKNIVTNAVDSTKIADGEVLGSHIKGKQLRGHPTVNNGHIAGNAITAALIGNQQISARLIDANAVVNDKGNANNDIMALNAVQAAHIPDDNIARAHLNGAVIDGAHLTNNLINKDHLAQNSIQGQGLTTANAAGKVVDNSVLAPNAIDTSAKIQNQSIVGCATQSPCIVAANTFQGSQDNAVSSRNLRSVGGGYAGIDSNKISSINQLSPKIDNIADFQITSGHIQKVIRTEHIAANSIPLSKLQNCAENQILRYDSGSNFWQCRDLPEPRFQTTIGQGVWKENSMNLKVVQQQYTDAPSENPWSAIREGTFDGITCDVNKGWIMVSCVPQAGDGLLKGYDYGDGIKDMFDRDAVVLPGNKCMSNDMYQALVDDLANDNGYHFEITAVCVRLKE